MDDFTAKAGVANMYGLVQSDTNRIEPGKRPLSSMTPTIVTRDGKPWMILGTPGGSRIITAVMQTMLNVIDYDMDLQEALDAPRIHQQWLPEETYVEARALSPDSRALLVAMGHKLVAPQPENHVAAILIGAPALNAKPVHGMIFYGAIDPRRNTGLALGY
jgi:gamma-glutamyltranspeptidase/glutathione hydrolase